MCFGEDSQRSAASVCQQRKLDGNLNEMPVWKAYAYTYTSANPAFLVFLFMFSCNLMSDPFLNHTV